jgi:hypothetical protein
MYTYLILSAISAVLVLILIVVGTRLVIKEEIGIVGVILWGIAYLISTVVFPYMTQQIVTHDTYSEWVAYFGGIFGMYGFLIGVTLSILLPFVAWAFIDTRSIIDWKHARWHKAPVLATPDPADPAAVSAYNAAMAARSQKLQGFFTLVIWFVVITAAYIQWSSRPNLSIVELVKMAQLYDATFAGSRPTFDAFYASHGRLRAGITLDSKFGSSQLANLKKVLEDQVQALPNDNEFKELSVDKILGVRFFSTDGKAWTNAIIYYSGKIPKKDGVPGREKERVIEKGFVRVPHKQSEDEATEINEALIKSIALEWPHPNQSESSEGGVKLFPTQAGSEFGVIEEK